LTRHKSIKRTQTQNARSCQPLPVFYAHISSSTNQKIQARPAPGSRNTRPKLKFKISQNQNSFTSLTCAVCQCSPTGKSGQPSAPQAGQPSQRKLLVEESKTASNKPRPPNPPTKLGELSPLPFPTSKVANRQPIAIYGKQRGVCPLLVSLLLPRNNGPWVSLRAVGSQPTVHCTYMSVPDTRTTFNYCCSYNWKRKTNGNFVLSIFTSALGTGELLGSRPGRFIPAGEGQYKLTRRLCGPQRQSGRFGGHRKHSPWLEFETGIVQHTASSVDRLRYFLQENSSWNG